MGELADASTTWLDRYWDPEAGLLWNMDGAYEELAAPRSFHLVAQSAWYAAGLLIRGAPGDESRAVATIEAVLACQYDEPGTPWHGTFARFLETPKPQPGAVMWRDYDPNWRQFIGTTFTLLLQTGQAGSGLDAGLRRRMTAAVETAVEGEPPDRVPPTYSNIALMRAWLEVEHGRAGADAYAKEVVDAFWAHGSFEEYNSPTYYGIDLYALALWRDHSSEPTLRERGAEIEAALWRDVARWYHPGMRNLCGPWSRSYGMDMRRYVALLGLWMWPVVGREAAAFPAEDTEMDHSHDFALAALVDYLGARVPEDAHDALGSFAGEREVSQRISSTPERLATGWLSDRVMVGAERGELGASARGQYHPATVHWQLPDGHIGWIRLVHAGPARAEAVPGRLTIECLPHARRGPQVPELRVYAPGAELVRGAEWALPGLQLRVSEAPSRIDSHDGSVRSLVFTEATDHIELGMAAR